MIDPEAKKEKIKAETGNDDVVVAGIDTEISEGVAAGIGTETETGTGIETEGVGIEGDQDQDHDPEVEIVRTENGRKRSESRKPKKSEPKRSAKGKSLHSQRIRGQCSYLSSPRKQMRIHFMIFLDKSGK